MCISNRSRDRSRERSRDRSRGSLSPIPDTRLDHKDGYKRRCRDFDGKYLDKHGESKAGVMQKINKRLQF